MNIKYCCAFCARPFAHLLVSTPDRIPPRVDDLLLCPQCDGLSKVTVEGTVKLTAEEFGQLDESDKEQLAFALRVINQYAGQTHQKNHPRT